MPILTVRDNEEERIKLWTNTSVIDMKALKKMEMNARIGITLIKLLELVKKCMGSRFVLTHVRCVRHTSLLKVVMVFP